MAGTATQATAQGATQTTNEITTAAQLQSAAWSLYDLTTGMPSMPKAVGNVIHRGQNQATVKAALLDEVDKLFDAIIADATRIQAAPGGLNIRLGNRDLNPDRVLRALISGAASEDKRAIRETKPKRS